MAVLLHLTKPKDSLSYKKLLEKGNYFQNEYLMNKVYIIEYKLSSPAGYFV